METFLITIFIITAILCFHSYFFYPLLIWVFGTLFPFKWRKDNIFPDISIIIPAYNEGKSIAQKIENTLQAEYPKEKREILVGSDGSNDETVKIVKSFYENGIRLFEFNVNRGKTAVQNDLVNQARGDILIFTDAASFIESRSLINIVRNFSDDSVGCVAGSMRFISKETNLATQGQGLYWRYEFMIRMIESNLGSLVGVDGPLYGMRKECYVPLEHHMISDFLSPLLVLAGGKRVILEKEAIVYEEPTRKSKDEFRTRRRITLRALIAIFEHNELLNFFKYPLLSFQIFSHKLLRWFVGPLLMINILSCAFLSNKWFFKGVIITYSCFFLLGLLGLVSERLGHKNRYLTAPYYFMIVNFAATMGIIDFFRKKKATTWKPVR